MRLHETPLNKQAILDFLKEFRPDVPIATMERTMENDAAMLLLTIGFESGRSFQSQLEKNTYAPHDIDYLIVYD